MADDQTDTNGDGGEALDPHIREQLRNARQVTKERDDALADLQRERRENVFTQVGIPTSGAGSLFRQAYNGELDHGSVRAAAEEYQVLVPVTTSAADTGLTDAERAAMQRVAGAGTGTPPAGQDHMEVAMTKLRQAGSVEEVMAITRQLEQEHPELGRFTNPN